MFGISQLKSYVRNQPVEKLCSESSRLLLHCYGQTWRQLLGDILLTLWLAVAVLLIGRTIPPNSLRNPFLKIIFVMTNLATVSAYLYFPAESCLQTGANRDNKQSKYQYKEKKKIYNRMTASVLKQDPNTKRFKRTLIYINYINV